MTSIIKSSYDRAAVPSKFTAQEILIDSYFPIAYVCRTVTLLYRCGINNQRNLRKSVSYRETLLSSALLFEYWRRHGERHSPSGHLVPNDVVSTSMRRNYVASTLIRRHFSRHVPAGSVWRCKLRTRSTELPWEHNYKNGTG